jgi:hypothetical protein
MHSALVLQQITSGTQNALLMRHAFSINNSKEINMSQLIFSPAVFSLSMSNSAAFKQGEIFGPCLQYQLAHTNQHRSSQQALSLWHH